MKCPKCKEPLVMFWQCSNHGTMFDEWLEEELK